MAAQVERVYNPLLQFSLATGVFEHVVAFDPSFAALINAPPSAGIPELYSPDNAIDDDVRDMVIDNMANDEGLTGGQIFGIVFAVLLVLVAVLVGLFFIRKRFTTTTQDESSQAM